MLAFLIFIILLSGALSFVGKLSGRRNTFLLREEKSDRLKEQVRDIKPNSLFVGDVIDLGVNMALAEEHLALGKTSEAKRLAKAAMRTAEHSGELNNIYEAYAEGILGECLYKEGDYKGASDHFKHALRTYEMHTKTSTGPETLAALGAVQYIAWDNFRKKKYADALPACTVALGMTMKLFGKSAPETAACMIHLASAQTHTGLIGQVTETLYKEALKIYRDEISKTKAGTDYFRDCNYILAGIYASMGDMFFLRDDIVASSESYSRVENMHHNGLLQGKEADLVAPSLRNFAVIMTQVGNYKRAEELFEKSLIILERNFGPEHPTSVQTKEMLASMRTRGGVSSTAEKPPRAK